LPLDNLELLKVNRPININKQGEEIELKSRRYGIYVLGGWGVNLGEFSISFKQIGTKEIATCQRAFWPVQAFAFGKRAKRILIVDIPEAGPYEVLFNNPETLIVKCTNLPISSLFFRPLPTEQIEIVITEKLGVFPILK